MLDRILIASGIKPGEAVADGYGYRNAPQHGRAWDLYQVYETEGNEHRYFEWEEAHGGR